MNTTLKPQTWFLPEDQAAVKKFLESPEGERWSSEYHKTTGNQTDLLSLKDCHGTGESKTGMWYCKSNAQTRI